MIQVASTDDFRSPVSVVHILLRELAVICSWMADRAPTYTSDCQELSRVSEVPDTL